MRLYEHLFVFSTYRDRDRDPDSKFQETKPLKPSFSYQLLQSLHPKHPINCITIDGTEVRSMVCVSPLCPERRRRRRRRNPLGTAATWPLNLRFGRRPRAEWNLSSI